MAIGIQARGEIGRKIWLKGFCAGNEGNHSFRLSDDRVLCTPSLISKGNLKPDDMCIVDMDGKQISGKRKARALILTPTPGCDEAAVEIASMFWKALGCRVVTMTPDEHDRAVAMVSHLPHAVAACLAGMIDGDHAALVMIIHEGIDRREVEDVLGHRWPDVVVKGLEREEPMVAMSPGDATDLGRCRRGIEPLRIVIMPQRDRQIAAPVVEQLAGVVGDSDEAGVGKHGGGAVAELVVEPPPNHQNQIGLQGAAQFAH